MKRGRRFWLGYRQANSMLAIRSSAKVMLKERAIGCWMIWSRGSKALDLDSSSVRELAASERRT
jgi:hypothetical protein